MESEHRSERRFDGRVAIVTGAGRGIGRAYALLLAELGAHVVVNDLGGSIRGAGSDEDVARAVVAEIEAAGDSAVADGHDVSQPDGADALIAEAVERFGRIDAVLNNAGIIRWAGPPDADAENLERHLAVHVGGSFNTTQAAWPHMVEQGYGRIVLTGSSGMFGLPANLSYAAAKAAMLGMANSLTVAGAEHGIKVNVIAPAAYTRMAGAGDGTDQADPMAVSMAPELVAPMAAFLAHESCPVSGEVYAAGAGRFARIFVAMTPGVEVAPGALDAAGPTIEDVAAHWSAINEEDGYRVPADLMDWSTTFLRHLPH